MDKYYKLPPEWAAKLNLTDTNPRHPDGWYLALPPDVIPLVRMNGTKEDGTWPTPDEAVASIGGCIYDTAAVLASQRGEKEYMMNRASTGNDQPAMSNPVQETPSEDSAVEPEGNSAPAED